MSNLMLSDIDIRTPKDYSCKNCSQLHIVALQFFYEKKKCTTMSLVEC